MYDAEAFAFYSHLSITEPKKNVVVQGSKYCFLKGYVKGTVHPKIKKRNIFLTNLHDLAYVFLWNMNMWKMNRVWIINLYNCQQKLKSV